MQTDHEADQVSITCTSVNNYSTPPPSVHSWHGASAQEKKFLKTKLSRTKHYRTCSVIGYYIEYKPKG
jgi:hypothetical protein